LTKATSRKQIQKINHTKAKEAQCDEREKKIKNKYEFLNYELYSEKQVKD